MQPEIATIAEEKLTETSQQKDDILSLEIAATAPNQYRVIRRNGKVTSFDHDKIKVAVTKAFLAVEGGNAAASSRIHEMVDELTEKVFYALTRSRPQGGTFHIEDIQDQVELALMRYGQHKIARAYVLYREERAKKRAEETKEQTDEDKTEISASVINV